MKVKKRDGNIVPFDSGKVRKAIEAAFKETKEAYDEELLDLLIDTIPHTLQSLSIDNIVDIETIQDIVEKWLMHENYFKTAKAYIIYRQKHKNIRDFADYKIGFIKDYIKSDNTANATIDDNSNVSSHNVAVLNSELHKPENQNINIKILEDKVRELYPTFDYKQLVKDLESICYLHDSSSQVGMPYCVAISLYPFLTDGLKQLGGLSAKPKNIDSFCGMFCNLVFLIASQFKGAVATPGLLLCMDWYLRKEWGDDYYKHLDSNISSSLCTKKKTVEHQIHQYFQQICYTLMQPSGGRGNQSVFWNLSIFDKPFYDTMYGDFYFPDGTQPIWESFNWLQKDFLHWLNQERLKTILTFPVCSACLIYQNGEFIDKDLYEFICQEYAEGNSFFTYISDSADSLSSCCRLSSKLEKPQFNFTNGQLSEMTGSKNVITLNLNRIVQDWFNQFKANYAYMNDEEMLKDKFGHNLHFYGIKIKEYLVSILDRIYKYQTAYNACLLELKEAKMLPAYDAGFINLKKQYLTIGINGLNQAAEFLHIKCNKNKQYEKFCNLIFSTIKEQNLLHKTDDLMFNTEFTPCESASIKLYNRDKKDGYWVPEDTNLYASYIFKPNDTEISVLDKLYLHGNSFCGDNLDGGSAAHINLDSHLSKEQYEKLVKYAAEIGCKYFTFNVPNSECDECGFITKVPITECPKCHSKKISYYDRVIGYLVKIKNWSKGRQIEQKTRVYTKKENVKL